MTTTLRPAGPERQLESGAVVRGYTVCVNSRAVGTVELSTRAQFAMGRIDALAIDEGERRRGRGTVAALAAEEVLRYRGCSRVETTVPQDAEYGLRMAAALGYTERNRNMAKDLDGARRPLPSGSVVRPLTTAEYDAWVVRDQEGFVASLTGSGVPRAEADFRGAEAFASATTGELPDGGTELHALDHEGRTVGRLWLRTSPEPGWVLSVEVDAGHRGHGHGRTLMLAAENACLDAGVGALALNVFAANTPAMRLYASLGYRISRRHLYKPLA